MTLDELKKLIENHENENLELKEWKNSISFDGSDKFENRKCILGYCVAIGNEGGGYLVIGVDNKKNIVGTDAQLAQDFKQKIYQKTGQKVEIYEIIDSYNNKVIVIQISGRGIGQLLKYAGVALMRVGDSLEVMSDAEQYKILSEGQDDWSAKICKRASFDNLNLGAIKKLRNLYIEKNKDSKIEGISDLHFLQDIGLIQGNAITNTCVLLVGDKRFIDENFAQAEICFEYRNKFQDIQFVDRVDYRDAFVLIAEEIWNKVYLRQQIHQIQQGLFRTDIPAYNQETFREALFNAECHRDYSQQGSIFIKQSPEYLEITNPGGLPFGVTIENMIDVPATPRNKLLAESFQKIFKGVERSGQGIDKIFRNTIEEGKGKPDYSKTTDHFVVAKIPAIVQDGNFISFIEKVTNEKNIIISMSDLLLLEKIRIGEKDGVTLQTVHHLVDEGLVELYGKTRGAIYILSQAYYQSINALGVRTKRIGLSRDKCKELILEHLKKHKTGTMQEFKQIFSELKVSDIGNLLTELKNDKKIEVKTGRTSSSVWGLIT